MLRITMRRNNVPELQRDQCGYNVVLWQLLFHT